MTQHDKEQRNKHYSRQRHLDSYFEYTHRHNGYMCLKCLRVNTGCDHDDVPKMLICVEDELPRRTASKRKWKSFFEKQRTIFTKDGGFIKPMEAYEYGHK